MNTCLDEGILQAYLDGELSPETSNNVATHLAACAACAAIAREIEQELALFATAFAPALPANVPTEKLRARLDEAIAGMQPTPRHIAPPAASPLRASFASFVAFLTTFTPRQATAFASVLVAVALAVVFVAMQSPDRPNTPQEIAKNNRTSVPADAVARVENSQTRNDQAVIQSQSKEISSPAPVSNNDRAPFVKAGFNARANASSTRAERGERKATSVPATPKNEAVLPDEKAYWNSIASLTSAIEAQGGQAMTPTLRAEYERNLAVVNQAIVSSRVAARRNPQDDDAKDFLRAAYQNKVELLSAVADQAQLASARD